MPPYQVVRSKLEKTRVLLTDPEIAKYIPKTVVYSKANLQEMLNDYTRVYIKPNIGRGGKRVIYISMNKDGLCRIHYETKVTSNRTLEQTASFITNVAAGDRFLIQQGIDLLKINSSPFDLRVNVQKPYSNWEVTAMIAKKNAPGKAVSNYCQGASLVKIDEALLRAGLTLSQTKNIKNLLIYIGQRTAQVLTKKYRGLRELGLDIGIDQNASPWILEVNTKPQYPKGQSVKFDRYRRIIQLDTIF